MKLQRTELKKARIEIIPMIDTIFFLLVYFMFISLSQVQMSAKQVALPVSSTAASKPLEKVVLTVDAQGNYYIDRAQVPYTDLLNGLKARVEENPHISVVINCDKTQQVAQFQYALNIAQQANPEQLMIATTPKDASQL